MAHTGVSFRVVVTNDDGIRASGLLVVARALVDVGHDVTVIAPIDEASGSSAATGAWHGASSRVVPFEHVPLDLPRNVPTFGLAAPPAMCVSIALAGAFGDPPECVVSGINRGRNVGGSVLHSGTIGAALTAVNLGCPAIALSIEAHRDEPHYETAAALGLELLDYACSLPSGHCVNLNAPDLAREALRGVRVATLGHNPVVFEAVADADEIHLLRGLRHATTLEAGTDERLTSDGYATITIVRPPRAHDDAEISRSLGPLVEALDEAFSSSATTPPGR